MHICREMNSQSRHGWRSRRSITAHIVTCASPGCYFRSMWTLCVEGSCYWLVAGNKQKEASCQNRQGGGAGGCGGGRGGGWRNSGMHRLPPPTTQTPHPALPQPGNPQRLSTGNQISHLQPACSAGMSRPHYPAHYAPPFIHQTQIPSTLPPNPLDPQPPPYIFDCLPLSSASLFSPHDSLSAPPLPLPPPDH